MKFSKIPKKKKIIVIIWLIWTIIFIIWMLQLSEYNKCKWVRVFNTECKK